MTFRRQFFRLSPLPTLLLGLACANIVDDGEDPDDDSGDGSGGSVTGGRSASGGRSTTGGRTSSGGTNSAGGASSGGMGGSPFTGGTGALPNDTGGSGMGTGGDGSGGTVNQPCDSIPALEGNASFNTGDLAVYVCPLAQAECTIDMVAEETIWECVAAHAPNCASQDPTGGSSWKFVGFCEELTAGGGQGGTML